MVATLNGRSEYSPKCDVLSSSRTSVTCFYQCGLFFETLRLGVRLCRLRATRRIRSAMRPAAGLSRIRRPAARYVLGAPPGPLRAYAGGLLR